MANLESAFRLTTLGGLSLSRIDMPLEGSVQKRSLILLAVLATARGSPVNRERLVSLLWPAADPDTARGALRQSLYAMRRESGSDNLVIGSADLRLNQDVINSDFEDFAAALVRRDWHAAAEAYGGPFLQDVRVRNSPEFDHWVDAKRSNLSEQYRRALETLSKAASDVGDHAAAVGWWRRITKEDPFSSRSAAGMMGALVAAGDSAAALKHYQIHEALIKQELDALPDPAVVKLAEQIRATLVRASASVLPVQVLTPRQEARAPGRRASLDEERIEASKTPDLALAAGASLFGRGRHAFLSGKFAIAAVICIALVGTAAPDVRVSAATHALNRVVAPAAEDPKPDSSLNNAGPIAGDLAIESVSPTSTANSTAPGAPLGSNRIVVAPFENMTGDSTLSRVGTIAADWLTDGLSRTSLVEVVDPGTAFVAARDANETTPAPHVAGANIAAIARLTNAQSVVAGSYTRSGDSLEFHARLVDPATGIVLASMEPVVVATAQPMKGVIAVRQKMLGLLARRLDSRLADLVDSLGPPPSFDAYVEYTLGMDAFVRRAYADAATHFKSAYSKDSSFATALIWSGYAFESLGRQDSARAQMAMLAPKKDRLRPLDRHAYDFIRHAQRGMFDSAIVAAKAAVAIAPKSQMVWNAALASSWANHPHETIRLLEQADPTKGWLKGWMLYFRLLAEAKHMVGDFDGEWVVIQRGRAQFPAEPFLASTLRSLVARRKFAELKTKVDDMLVSNSPATGRVLWRVIRELLIHKNSAEAERVFAQFKEWYLTRGRLTPDGKWNYELTLLETRRWAEAREVGESFMAEFPNDRQMFGFIGLAAAKEGDTATARMISDSLAHFPDRNREGFSPGSAGGEPGLRSAIEAALGHRAKAVQLLNEAYRSGTPKNDFGHSIRGDYPELYGYQPFEDFFRPDH